MTINPCTLILGAILEHFRGHVLVGILGHSFAMLTANLKSNRDMLLAV